jgi:hypothetical protein
MQRAAAPALPFAHQENTMKTLARLLLPLAMLGFSGLATAASGDDDRGRANREFKQEYRDGDCKVKREAKKDGEYKEERECKGGRAHARAEARGSRVYQPAYPAEVHDRQEASVRVDVRVRQ